jgi:3-hydroxyacyl-CoA dehydrogenase
VTVDVSREGEIAVVTITNSPVNALNRAVRESLWGIAGRLDAEPGVAAVVLMGAGKMFVGGADIAEFDRPPEPPNLPDVIGRIEASSKPWVAAIYDVAFGGGLEIALGCRFRVATPGTKLALPEVNLGIIPGAGGSQRLPRLIGVKAAIPIVAEASTVESERALELGLIDLIVADDLRSGAVAFVREALTRSLPRRVYERAVASPEPEFWSGAETRIAKQAKGAVAPPQALAALRFGVEMGFAAGIVREREIFLALRDSEQAAALRYLFFAERAATRPAHLKDVPTLPLRSAAVIGGGTMGVGIAAALRDAGLPVTLLERDEASLSRAINALRNLFDAAARRGRLSADEAVARMAGVTGTLRYDALRNADLAIEAVFEDLDVKREVFAQLGAACRETTILATNTSYLDPREIAKGLPHPERFLGLHFFSPAQVMKLLEIIPTGDTRPEVLATGFALARLLGKVPVQAGICDGFIGNRILRRYRSEAEALMASGVPFESIDAAMRGFGFAMGPFEVQDLAGLDISFLHREAARARGEVVPETPGDLLVRAGRKGQKTGGGWYDYTPNDRTPLHSDETTRILAPTIAPPVEMAPDRIAGRLVSAMAAEGQAILDEGIAARASDIDLVEVHGYGFPRWRGGPMWLASRQGKVNAIPSAAGA